MSFVKKDASNPADRWYFYVNGYKVPYDKEATWANDWLVGGIMMIINGQEQLFPMNHLLIEEFQNFINWLTKINDNATANVNNYFGFTDADLSFEFMKAEGKIMLRLVYGYANKEQIRIDTGLGEYPEFITRQTGRIQELMRQYPCRCGTVHR